MGRTVVRQIRRVRRSDRGRRGELADRDVIGVAVGANLIERQHDLRAHATQMPDDLADGFVGIRLIQVSVRVVEKADLLDSEHGSRVQELLFPDSAHGFRTRILGAVMLAAALSPRCGYDVDLDSLRTVLGQGASRPR